MADPVNMRRVLKDEGEGIVGKTLRTINDATKSYPSATPGWATPAPNTGFGNAPAAPAQAAPAAAPPGQRPLAERQADLRAARQIEEEQQLADGTAPSSNPMTSFGSSARGGKSIDEYYGAGASRLGAAPVRPTPTPMAGDQTSAETQRLARNNQSLREGASPFTLPQFTAEPEKRDPNAPNGIGGAEVMASDLRNANRMEQERLAMEAAGRENQGRLNEYNKGVGQRFDDAMAKQKAEVQVGTIGTDRGSEAKRAVAAQTLRGFDEQANTRIKEEGWTGRNKLDNATSRANNTATTGATLRGQDMTARTAAATARMEQFNKDREFAFNEKKFGTETAQKMADDKRASGEAFTKRIGSMIPPGPDGKPDGAKAAQVLNGANTFLADRMAKLQAHLAKNPQDAQAAGELATIRDKGLDGLDEDTIRTFVLGQKANTVAQEYDGWMPWKGKAKPTDAPISSLRRKEGWIFDDYVSDDASGNQVIPARALREYPDLGRLVK